MRNQVLASIAALTLAIVPAAGQATKTAPKANTAPAAKATWTAPRTADGQIDLQGVWTNNTVTPLQRPRELAGKEFYTEAEVAKLQKNQQDRLAVNYVEGEPPANHSGVPGAAAEYVHYDHAQFGLDWLQSTMAWNRRTSLIVGPDGRIPPLTPDAQKRVAARAASEKGHEFDGPENRPLGSRCVVRDNVGPPLLPTRYNSNFRIAQSPGYVVIEAEEIHDSRVVRLDGRPHLPKNVRQWMGDSIGRWEGNTLVVDTTNFTDRAPFSGAQNLHVIERLTRTDQDTILYQFTVEDPGMWTKPWSGEIPVKKIAGPLWEYACHEANYGLENTLRGARVGDAEATKKTK